MSLLFSLSLLAFPLFSLFSLVSYSLLWSVLSSLVCILLCFVLSVMLAFHVHQLIYFELGMDLSAWLMNSNHGLVHSGNCHWDFALPPPWQYYPLSNNTKTTDRSFSLLKKVNKHRYLYCTLYLYQVTAKKYVQYGTVLCTCTLLLFCQSTTEVNVLL